MAEQQPGSGGDSATGNSRWMGALLLRLRRAIQSRPATMGSAPSSLAHGASGQIVALFALSLVAIVPVLALIIDGGNVYVQRRTTQNAADAASLAGTRALMNAPISSDTTIATEVCKYLAANSFGTTPTATARFVGTDGLDVIPAAPITTNAAHTLLDCSQNWPNTIPNTASGVRVDAQIDFNTYLAGVVLGGKPGIPNMTTNARAGVLGAAITSSDAHNAPFIICGVDTWKTAGGGTKQSVLKMLNPTTPATPYAINPAAVGQSFVIHSAGGVATCGLSTSFQGLADIDSNAGSNTMPSDLFALGGANPAPTATAVDGYSGCAIGPLSPNIPCTLILPLATLDPSLADLHCVLWAAFDVTLDNSGNHTAKLRANYAVSGGPASSTWTWASSYGAGGSPPSIVTLGLSR